MIMHYKGAATVDPSQIEITIPQNGGETGPGDLGQPPEFDLNQPPAFE